MDNNKSIGVSGIAGSGKDTFAKMLIEELHSRGNTSYSTYAFAGPLKDFAMNVFNFSVYDVYDQVGKELNFLESFYTEKMRGRFDYELEMLLNRLSLQCTGTLADWKEDFGTERQVVLDTFWRDFLEVLDSQIVPVNALTKFSNWWSPEDAKITFKSTPRIILQLLGTEFFRERITNNFWTAISPKTNVIYTDLRFENEGKFIKENNGVIIGITGRSENTTKSSGHASENVDAVINMADFRVYNNGTLDELRLVAKSFVNTYFGETK